MIKTIKTVEETLAGLQFVIVVLPDHTGLVVIKLEYKLRLKIKRNDWLLADTCPQTANNCALF